MQPGALVLLVDPQLQSRHGLWRCLSEPFGVIEATTARGATRWIDERPDIDALVVEDDLPDGRGADLAASLAAREHPLAKHTIVMTRARPQPAGGITVVERGDLRAVMSTLTSWFAVRDLPQARRLGEVWSRLPSRIAALRPRS